ncbi:SIS domain-containing protein [Avibacterium avium]|uniref:SIS domain-containing protein n=1 Tax=Avibacterium avium TaxID=751 RepID=UPI003BF820C9
MTSYLGFSESELVAGKAIMTAKEIEHQPQAWLQALQTVEAQRQQILDFIAPVINAANGRVIFTGAGTSAFVGHSLQPFVLTLTDKRVESIATTDIVSNPYQYFAQDVPTLLISFARSGNSPESVAAVELANQCLTNCYHLFITCNEQGALYQNAQKNDRTLALLMPPQTNDGGFAMTSSFSSMMLSALSVFLLPKGSVVEQLQFICDATEKLIPRYVDYARQLSKVDMERIIYLGSGGLQGLAQESALKILELTAGRIVATYDSPLGFRHGPKSIVNPKTVVVEFLSNQPYTRLYDLDLYNELRRDNIASRVVCLTAQAGVEGEDVIEVEGFSNAPDYALLFPYIVFAQVNSFYSSFSRGITTDNPCPTGEVNRVVQGVIIHPFNS